MDPRSWRKGGYVHILMRITEASTAACNLFDTDTLFQGVTGKKPVTFQGGLSHHHLNLQPHKDRQNGLGNPTKPNGNYGSSHQLPREVIHQACIPISNIQIYLGLLARPPDLQRHSNGLPDRAKTHSLSSPMSQSVFSQTCTHTHTCAQGYTNTHIQPR